MKGARQSATASVGRAIGVSCAAILLTLAGGVPAADDEEGKDEEEKETEEENGDSSEVLARLDIENSDDGSLPGGATRREGGWSVDAEAEKLRLAPEPLVAGWLAFGPEIRERAATVVATARAPGDGRIRSRVGVGLYGKNGFQLRAVLVRDEVELVRRGAVLLRRSFSFEAGALHDLELAVNREGEKWVLTGRVWRHDDERPDEPLLRHRVVADELKFPLAGRSALVGTPFSGEPVEYAAARVYDGVYVPAGPEEEKKKEGDGENGEQGDG